MTPQLHPAVCVNTSNTTSDAASVSSEFVDTDFIWMVAAPQFLIILTELIETMKEFDEKAETFNKYSEKNYNLRNLVGNGICSVIYGNSFSVNCYFYLFSNRRTLCFENCLSERTSVTLSRLGEL